MKIRRRFHRDAPTDSGNPNPGGGGGTGASPTPSAPAEPPAAQPFDPNNLPPEVRKYIADQVKAADEKARTTTRDNAAKTAVEQVKDQIAQALGIKPTEVDPAQVAAELAQARTANAQFRIEVEAERVARKAGADEELVVAKLARDGKLRGLDPDADDFKTKIKTLVDEAVAANPRLKLDTTTPPPPGARGAVGGFNAPEGGEGGRKRPSSLGEAINAAYAPQK